MFAIKHNTDITSYLPFDPNELSGWLSDYIIACEFDD